MERSQLFDLMGELELYGMKAAFDEIMATAVKRQREPQRIVGDLLNAEIDEKQARSIKYQLTIAKLPLASPALSRASTAACGMSGLTRRRSARSPTPGSPWQRRADYNANRPHSRLGWMTPSLVPARGPSRCATGKLRTSPRCTSSPNGFNSTEDSTHRWMKDRGHVHATIPAMPWARSARSSRRCSRSRPSRSSVSCAPPKTLQQDRISGCTSRSQRREPKRARPCTRAPSPISTHRSITRTLV
jgi:hypothetical protein